jgi:hypothetical protein
LRPPIGAPLPGAWSAWRDRLAGELLSSDVVGRQLLQQRAFCSGVAGASMRA